VAPVERHVTIEHAEIAGGHRRALRIARLEAENDESAGRALHGERDAGEGSQRFSGAQRPVQDEVVLRVHQTRLMRLERREAAERARHRPFVANGEKRMHPWALRRGGVVEARVGFAEAGAVGHHPARVDGLLERPGGLADQR